MTEYIEAIGSSFERKAATVDGDCQRVIYKHKTQGSLQPIDKVKNIIAVASGKGGVGKSTISFNLAATLAQNGLKVGLIDADIYGPSLPILIGCNDRLEITEDKKFIPHSKYQMSCISIGHLVAPETALAWRGPMATGAMLQLFQQTLWPELDVLIVDLPPGTGDILLTLCQKIPLVGSVIVSHPHPLAQADKERALSLFHKMGVPVLLETCNMHPGQQKELNNALSYSSVVYESTALSQPLCEYAPDSVEQKQLQLWAEALIDALAEQPISASISFKMK